jgi:hypothetical protein
VGQGSSIDEEIMAGFETLGDHNRHFLLAIIIYQYDPGHKYASITETRNLLAQEDNQYLKPLLQRAHEQGNFDTIRKLRTRPLSIFTLILDHRL